MAKRKVGSPALLVRMPQEMIDLLKARGEKEFGPVATAGGARAGGASKLVRRLVYEFFGIEPPPEWGERNPEHAAYQRARRARLAAQKAAEEAPDQTQDPTT